jgi:hypothetical protein
MTSMGRTYNTFIDNAIEKLDEDLKKYYREKKYREAFREASMEVFKIPRKRKIVTRLERLREIEKIYKDRKKIKKEINFHKKYRIRVPKTNKINSTYGTVSGNKGEVK